MRTLTLAACLALAVFSAARGNPPGVKDDQSAAKATARFRFQAIDGDPEKDKPEELAFQITRTDVRSRTHFLRLGDTIPDTRFKLESFVSKIRRNAKGTEEDVSELTLINLDTKEVIRLIRGAPAAAR